MNAQTHYSHSSIPTTAEMNVDSNTIFMCATAKLLPNTKSELVNCLMGRVTKHIRQFVDVASNAQSAPAPKQWHLMAYSIHVKCLQTNPDLREKVPNEEEKNKRKIVNK